MIRKAPLRRAINIQLLDILGVCGTAHNRRHDNEAEHCASRPRCTIASDILRAQIKFRHIKAMQCAVNDGNAHDEPHRTHHRKISRIDMLWRLPMHITYTCLAHLIYLFLHPIACLPFLYLVVYFKFVSMFSVPISRTSSSSVSLTNRACGQTTTPLCRPCEKSQPSQGTLVDNGNARFDFIFMWGCLAIENTIEGPRKR